MTYRDDIYTEVALSDSTMYKYFNAAGALTQKLVASIKNSEEVEPKWVEEQLIQIKRSRISPLADDVIHSFDIKEIHVIYTHEKSTLEALPFFVTKSGMGVTAFIFINNYGKIVSDIRDPNIKYLDIPMKNLYALLEAAYVARKYALNPRLFTRNIGLMKICVDAYVQMYLRILNKEYSLVMDEEASIKTSFAIAKFFLDNVWGDLTPDMSFNYARVASTQKITYDLTQLNDEYNAMAITNIEDLMKFLSTITPRMKSLTMRLFTDQFMRTYQPSALFSLETLPYFLFVLQSTMVGAFLVNQPMVNDILKIVKGATHYYPELLKSTK